MLDVIVRCREVFVYCSRCRWCCAGAVCTAGVVVIVVVDVVVVIGIAAVVVVVVVKRVFLIIIFYALPALASCSVRILFLKTANTLLCIKFRPVAFPNFFYFRLYANRLMVLYWS